MICMDESQTSIFRSNGGFQISRPRMYYIRGLYYIFDGSYPMDRPICILSTLPCIRCIWPVVLSCATFVSFFFFCLCWMIWCVLCSTQATFVLRVWCWCGPVVLVFAYFVFSRSKLHTYVRNHGMQRKGTKSTHASNTVACQWFPLFNTEKVPQILNKAVLSSHQNWKLGWNWNDVTEKFEVCVCWKVLMWWKNWKFEE